MRIHVVSKSNHMHAAYAKHLLVSSKTTGKSMVTKYFNMIIIILTDLYLSF